MNREDGVNRIQEVLGALPVGCSPEQAEKLYDWYKYLTEKNKEFNLTAITEFEEVLEKHYYDSLLYVPEGFPGMPLAIFHPDVQFVLMDSLAKRIRFIEESVEMLNLTNVTAVHARAEDLARDPAYREQFDACVSRAVSQLRVLAEYDVPFVKVGGEFVPYKSGDIAEELEEAEKALKVLGVKLEKKQKEVLPVSQAQRTLLHFRKKKETPKAYPRKAGTPAKKPL